MSMLQVVFCRSPTDGNVCGAFSVGNLAGLFKRQAWMRKYLVRIEDVHVESFYLKGIVRIERMKQNIFQHLDRRGLWN